MFIIRSALFVIEIIFHEKTKNIGSFALYFIYILVYDDKFKYMD